MPELTKAKESFTFYTRLHLFELTGLKASTIRQLLEFIKEVSGSSIYHHTHRSLQQHQYLSPEPTNDFAYWVSDVLGEDELGEELSSVDTIQFSSIRSLRERIIEVIERFLNANPLAEKKFSREGDEFHFIKCISFILPTHYVAYDLKDFTEILRKITFDSIYFHIFESRLRLERPTNDFSNWIETSVGDKELAKKISRLDPYTLTLEGLRMILIKTIEAKISR